MSEWTSPLKTLEAIAQHHLGGKAYAGSDLCDLYVECVAGYFTLRRCENVAFSCDLFVRPEYRQKGWSSRFEAAKQALCHAEGIEMILATVRKDNAPEIAAIQKHGWKQLYELKDTWIWCRDVEQPRAEQTYLED